MIPPLQSETLEERAQHHLEELLVSTTVGTFHGLHSTPRSIHLIKLLFRLVNQCRCCQMTESNNREEVIAGGVGNFADTEETYVSPS